MKQTQEPGNTSTILLNSPTPIQRFENLLARYKVRVYEMHSDEITGMGSSTERCTRPEELLNRSQPTTEE